jgi:hypothetical protein
MYRERNVELMAATDVSYGFLQKMMGPVWKLKGTLPV